jgi:serine/threonine-protein kinase
MQEKLGHHKIVSELGRGGMGVVYKAYEESLNRYVAIKVLGEHLGHDESFVKRFVREAKAAAGLSHPNVIQIFSIGQEGDRHYFVMEFVEGRSVHDLLETDGAIEPSRASRIVLQAASGLAAAHDQGLVHRDIKPANLLVTKDERVKIADFGLALAPSDGATRLTATNSLMGTPGYLSPEQCCGEPAGPRSDIYSLGMTFYEMLAGSMPFKGESPLAVLRQILDEDPPPLLGVAPHLDPRIAKVVERMVAKQPNDRYQSCHEVVADLSQILGVSAAAPRPATAGVAAAQVATAPAAAGGGSVRTPFPATGRPEDAPTRVAPSRPLTGGAGSVAAGIAASAAAPSVPSIHGTAAASVVAAPEVAPGAAVPPPPAVAPAVAAAAPRSGGSAIRWLVIGGMAVMLVAAVSAAGLFLGLPLLRGDSDDEAAAESSMSDVADHSRPEAAGNRRREATTSKDLLATTDDGAPSSTLDESTGESVASEEDQEFEQSAEHVAPASTSSDSGQESGAATAASRAAGTLAASPREAGGGEAAAARVPAPAAPPRRPVIREHPRVAVIAVGEPMLAGAAEQALESQLARHGVDLFDEGGILELRDSGGASSVSPSHLVGVVADRGGDVVVLIEVQPLKERELQALGRYSYATTSRVRVDAFLAADGDGIGRGWSEQIEYAEANAERQADTVMGHMSTQVAESIAAAWKRYRSGAR